MPFQIKVQPIDARSPIRSSDPAAKPGSKSRLKRLFEKQFTKIAGASDGREKDGGEIEPGSVCLDRLVVGFMEGCSEKPSRCGRNRCNCFNVNCEDNSDDDSGDAPPFSAVDASEIIKDLVPCESVTERNLLADASKIVECNRMKIGKGKENCMRIVTENLQSSGYDASICKSKWEKTPSLPAGEYEYIDVIVDGDRYILDVDFRSEFEIARSTKKYRVVLQSLPLVFVGKPDRIQRMVTVVSEAARQSLKKKGLHFPPWRKLEYMKAKWLAPHGRLKLDNVDVESHGEARGSGEDRENSAPVAISAVNFDGEVEMSGEVAGSPWTPPAVTPRSAATAGARVVTGLASVLTESSPLPSEF